MIRGSMRAVVAVLVDDDEGALSALATFAPLPSEPFRIVVVVVVVVVVSLLSLLDANHSFMALSE